MIVETNDRVFIAGKTGSGKTWLAQKLLASVDRLIILDSKGTLNDWNAKNLRAFSGLAWMKFERGGAARFRVLPPIVDNPQAWYESLFERLYGLGDLTVYIDEAYAVQPPGSRPGAWLSALYTRGRENGIGVWASTQRPSWIPLFLMSESDWLVTFRLTLEVDKKKMASMMGEQVLNRIPDEHGFWLYNVQSEEPRYYRTAVLARDSAV